MPVTIETKVNERIIIATLEGHVTVNDLDVIYQRSAALIQQMGGMIHRVTDARLATSSFADILRLVREASKGLPGSATDPNVKTVFVGNHEMLRLVADMLRQPQFGHIQIPMFPTLEDALVAVRHEISKQDKMG
jgi:hypothetical protein